MLCYSIAHRKIGEKTYEFDEILKDRKKKPYILYGATIKKLDDVTSISSSPEDLCELEKEIIIGTLREEDRNIEIPTIEEPFILVEGTKGEEISDPFITDIVYSKDKKILDNRYSIKVWAEEFFTKNPKAIYECRYLSGMYFTRHNGEELTADLATRIVNACIKNNDYIQYRDLYFRLKELDPETAKRVWNL